MDVNKYMEKYARIAGIEKEAVPRRLGKSLHGPTDMSLGRKTPKSQDPGYVFLNSGQFQKLFLPSAPVRAEKQKAKKLQEEIVDMFGRVIGNEGLFN